MARPRRYVPLDVFLNGRAVGQLRRSVSGAIDFTYANEWLEWEHAFAISLSLPLREDRYSGEAVVAVFDNLLPDSDEVRRRVATLSGAEGADLYSLLAALGRDCVGALQFFPDGDVPTLTGAITSKPISNEVIAARLRALVTAPLGLSQDSPFRISLAGVQDKTAFLKIDETWHEPRGATATTHIFKTQIGQRGTYDLRTSVENEHYCLACLKALGLPVAETEIRDFGEIRALIVTRFDRQWTKDGRLLRVPQEDFCQALSVPPDRKYQSDGGPGIVDILRILRGSDEPFADQMMVLKAQIAFWLLAAIDGHAKNFSIFLAPGGGFRLTPLYDVVSAQPLLDQKQIRRRDVRLAMSVGNNRHYRIDTIRPRHFLQTETSANLTVGSATDALLQIADDLPGAIEAADAAMPTDFPRDVRESIAAGALRRCQSILDQMIS